MLNYIYTDAGQAVIDVLTAKDLEVVTPKDRHCCGIPREIIRGVPGVALEEMKTPDRCCGSAGSFRLMHYKLSSKIRDCKIGDILSVALIWCPQAAGLDACR